MEFKLVRNHSYGIVARDIFDECVNKLGFDRNKSGLFSNQQELYARFAAPGGYSVWFLRYSNISKYKQNKNKNKKNTFNQCCDELKYEWDESYDEKYATVNEKRLVFAMKEDEQYYFMGIFECDVANKINCFSHHRLISDVYPMN